MAAVGEGTEAIHESVHQPSVLNLAGVVEPALAEALKLAARAGRWDIVEQLAQELEARRKGRCAGQVAAAAHALALGGKGRAVRDAR